MSSGNQVLLGQYGATNRTYSSSSLILHRGTYICTGPGASCVPVHPCRALTRIGSRTIGNARFLEMQTGLPEQLQTHSKSAGPPWDGVSTPQEVPLENAQRNHSTNSEESIAVIARVWLGQRYHTQRVQHSRVVIPGERERALRCSIQHPVVRESTEGNGWSTSLCRDPSPIQRHPRCLRGEELHFGKPSP